MQHDHVDGVIGRHIHQLIGHRQRIGLVTGIANRPETLGRIDPARSKDKRRGDQEAAGGIGIAQTEIDGAITGQDIVQRLDRAVDRNKQDGVIALATIRISRLGKDFAAREAHGLQAGEIREPAKLHAAIAHGLDHAGIVGGIEGLDIIPRPLGHRRDEGTPVGLAGICRFRGDDAEIDGPPFTLGR